MEEQRKRISRKERHKKNKKKLSFTFLNNLKNHRESRHDKKVSKDTQPIYGSELKEKEIITNTNDEPSVDTSHVSGRRSRAERNELKKKKKLKNISAAGIIGVTSVIVLYIGIAFYFENHFYFGTHINDLNVSGKNIESAITEIKNNVSDYSVELQGRNNISDEIKGSDINLQYDDNCESEIRDFKKAQNNILWPIDMLKNKEFKIDNMVTFHDDLLERALEKTVFYNDDNTVESKNPEFIYNNGSYEVTEEVYGTKINKEILYNVIKDGIMNENKIINLEDSGCYEDPKYSRNSKEVNNVKELLNGYVSTKITYNFANSSEAIDSDIINKWLSVDDNLNVIINEDEIRNYMTSLAAKYTTAGKTRSFTTTNGSVKQIEGGNYGWKVDLSNEAEELIENIKNKTPLTKDVEYSQKAFSTGENDIGNTYVEIDMSNQHLWFYKNGALITQGDVVTGNVSSGFSTPAGTYKLTYKQKDAVLVGENYRSPVSFWMPFNNNIGIHDASWRSVFGGSIYRSSGSHGCVNAPYALAKSIYENIESSTPIVCYY